MICMRADYKREDFRPWKIRISVREVSGWRTIGVDEYTVQSAPVVRANDCLPWDQNKSFNALQPGYRYSASAKNRVGPDRYFSADICLVGTPGAYRIHQVRPDKKTGVRDWAPCNLKLAELP